MYGAGMHISAISRVLGVKWGTVYSWVQKSLSGGGGRAVSAPAAAGGTPVQVLSCDARWTYVGARRKGPRHAVRIGTAVVAAGEGSRWLDFKMGQRDAATCGRWYARRPDAQRYRSAACTVYQGRPRPRHSVGQGSAGHRHEGAHSVLRGTLHRLRRTTQGYAKSPARLTGARALMWLGWDWI